MIRSFACITRLPFDGLENNTTDIIVIQTAGIYNKAHRSSEQSRAKLAPITLFQALHAGEQRP
jgi:hypothetical protein